MLHKRVAECNYEANYLKKVKHSIWFNWQIFIDYPSFLIEVKKNIYVWMCLCKTIDDNLLKKSKFHKGSKEISHIRMWLMIFLRGSSLTLLKVRLKSGLSHKFLVKRKTTKVPLTMHFTIHLYINYRIQSEDFKSLLQSVLNVRRFLNLCFSRSPSWKP